MKMVKIYQLGNRDRQSGSKKYDPTICCFQEIHFKYNSIGRLKVKGWKKIFHVSTSQKKSCISIKIKSILISEEVTLKQRKFTREKGISHNDKWVNQPRRHSNPKCVFTKQQSYKIYEAKTNITERRNQQIHSYSEISTL